MKNLPTPPIVKKKQLDFDTYYLEAGNCMLVTATPDDLSLLELPQCEMLSYPTCYMLLQDAEAGNPLVHIGHAENFLALDMPFWGKVLLFFAKDHSMAATDMKYVEHLAVTEARLAKNDMLSNKRTTKMPFMPEYQEAINHQFFEEMKTLALAAGCEVMTSKRDI